MQEISLERWTNIANALVLALEVACGCVGIARQMSAKAPEEAEIRRAVGHADGSQESGIFRGWAMTHFVEIVTHVAALARKGQALEIMASCCIVKLDALGSTGKEFQMQHERTNHEARAALARLAMHGNNVLGALG